MECKDATFCSPTCCAGSLVLQTGSADNVVAVDCSEPELVHITDANDVAAVPVTTNCLEYPEEATDVNTASSLTSQERSSSHSTNHMNRELACRTDIRPFMRNDETVLSSNFSNNYSKPTLIRNPELKGGCGERDKAHEPQQGTIPHLSCIDEKPDTGNSFC